MRRTIDMGGSWEFYPLYGTVCDTSLPDELPEAESITVPSGWKAPGIALRDFNPGDIYGYPGRWNDADTGVLRRRVHISAEPGERVFLNAEGVAQRCALYVGARHICDHDEVFLPLHADITDGIADGEAEITFVCASFESTTLTSGSVKTTGLTGSWFGSNLRGIWGDISLEILPQSHISDLAIRCSVRRGEISVLPELSDAPDGARMHYEVLDGERAVLSFDGGCGEAVCRWTDAEYWDTDHPKLYRLRAELVCGGTVLDSRTERFGFREIWTEGTKFILNGKPINLRGDSWHFQGPIQMTKQYALNWYELCRQNGVNYVRLHAEPHPRYYLDAADEVGMLIVDETAVYGSGKGMDAAHPQYLERCGRHAVRLVRRDRNHPCVIFWSIENEMRWVDGRDEFKLHIPDWMEAMHREDPTRLISLDGDNRLLPYEMTEIESYHYNIDGTIAQWRREKPLTVGEHGGMWFVCPQNASAYVGLGAYDDFEPCAIGFAAKERLFQEDARRKGVSGISTFNFAYYFTRSMPDEDIYTGDPRLPKIPKYSLTINNGMLPPEYPLCRENPVMAFMREAYRPVTIIRREYNSSFYDGEPLRRSFDVYNDTREAHEVTVECRFSISGAEYRTELHFTQQPAEHKTAEFTLPLPELSERGYAELVLTLRHEGAEQFTLRQDYNIYPRGMRTEPLRLTHRVFVYGSDGNRDLISPLCPDCTYIGTPAELEHCLERLGDGDILVLGEHLTDDPEPMRAALREFVRSGGRLIVLAQSTYIIGELSMTDGDFFSAHAGNPEHPLLRGITDADMIFWGPTVTEERPEPFIHRCYEKPAGGGYTFVLECAAGDYADGGDLWSPLMAAQLGCGTILLCQIELGENYSAVPQAAQLLRNMLEYADTTASRRYRKVYSAGTEAAALLDRLGTPHTSLLPAALAHRDENGICLADGSADTYALAAFARAGGDVLIISPSADRLSHSVGRHIALRPAELSHAKVTGDPLTRGISPVDLFRYDKVPMSPRQVENKRLAFSSVEIEGGEALVCDVPNTIWEDSFWHRIRREALIIPMVSMNREHPREPLTLVSRFPLGDGSMTVSTLTARTDDEKDIRVYAQLLSGLGAQTDAALFDCEHTEERDAVQYFMTLPIEPWQDIDRAREYYTDPQFSLNNLGEGLYGWMLKVERDRESGIITVPNSAGRHYFLTAFADKERTERIKARLWGSVPLRLYVDGGEVYEEELTMTSGRHRIVIEADNTSSEPLRFRMLLLGEDGRPLPDLRIRLTIDEVDPK